MAVLIMALQLSRESYTGFSSSTIMVVVLPQPEKAPFPMFTTELGMKRLVKLQAPYLQVVFYQQFVIKTVEKWRREF